MVWLKVISYCGHDRAGLNRGSIGDYRQVKPIDWRWLNFDILLRLAIFKQSISLRLFTKGCGSQALPGRHGVGDRQTRAIVRERTAKEMIMTIDPAALQDQDVLMSDGEHVRLGDLWKDRPLALVFLRHYG
jgi:hypothetical protein